MMIDQKFPVSLLIPFSRSYVWDPEEWPESHKSSISNLWRNTESIRKVLFDEERILSFPCEFKILFQNRIASLRYAVKENSLSKVIDAIAHLIGFGPGLTPSGDDFIVGFISSYHYLKKSKFNLSINMNDFVEQILLLYKNKTTFIGEMMIYEACKGRFFKPIVELMRNLFLVIKKIPQKGTLRLSYLNKLGRYTRSIIRLLLAEERQEVLYVLQGESPCWVRSSQPPILSVALKLICLLRKRVSLKSPVRQFRTLGSVRGQSGNWLSYRDNLQNLRSFLTRWLRLQVLLQVTSQRETS